MTLVNSHVKNVAASAAVYRVSEDQMTYSFQSNDCALAYGGEGILKKNFHDVHKGTASLKEQQRFLNAYGVDLNEFQSSLRTVGVGTNIILHERSSGSIYIPMVTRTASGNAGVSNLGKTSRAAGGAFEDIAASGFRELSEEFICARNEDSGVMTVLNLVYQEPCLVEEEAKLITDVKNLNAEGILHEYNIASEAVEFQELRADVICVPDFTCDITQIIDGEEKAIQSRFITDPVAGDINIDVILYVELPDNISMASLLIRDGEENFDGDLLKRDWVIKTPDEWLQCLDDGLKMSQGPQNFYNNWDKIEQAIKLKL